MGLFFPSDLAWRTLGRADEFAALPRPILSIHVRRGDNVFDPGVPNKHLYMPTLPASYYNGAADELRPKAASVACFSDDIPWCRENIPADYYHEGVARAKDGTPGYWTDPVLDWIDFFLMARCDLHVCSASSYAWWGAFLSGDPSPIIPTPWFGPALAHIDTSLMVVPGWQQRPSCS